MEKTAVAVGEGNVLSNTTEYLHQVLAVDQQALPVCVCVCVVAILYNLPPDHKCTTTVCLSYPLAPNSQLMIDLHILKPPITLTTDIYYLPW